MGQSSEIAIFGGTATAKTDINRSMFVVHKVYPAFGLYYRHCFNNHWSYRLSVVRAKVYGNDALTNSAYFKNRNLNYFSPITEFGANLEFNFFQFQVANPRSTITPFISAGFNIFRFNPKTNYNGDVVLLQPLGTEGQGTSITGAKGKYKRTSTSFSMGGGIKIRLANRWGITLDGMGRKASTDYLDDVSTNYADKVILAAENGALAAALSDLSKDQLNNNVALRQRGNSTEKDWYFIGGLSISFTLKKDYHNICKPFRVKLH
ncbi:MAG: hypothetical protein IPO27_05010 [Bacteroidetes bacterium]|nr:hypothetical protein [Bacteroidota bacterium]